MGALTRDDEIELAALVGLAWERQGMPGYRGSLDRIVNWFDRRYVREAARRERSRLAMLQVLQDTQPKGNLMPRYEPQQTTYLVLTENGDGSWQPRGKATTANAKAALAEVLLTHEGLHTAVAVPLRSWQPQTVRAEMRPRLISEKAAPIS